MSNSLLIALSQWENLTTKTSWLWPIKVVYHNRGNNSLSPSSSTIRPFTCGLSSTSLSSSSFLAIRRASLTTPPLMVATSTLYRTIALFEFSILLSVSLSRPSQAIPITTNSYNFCPTWSHRAPSMRSFMFVRAGQRWHHQGAWSDN